MDSLLDRAVRSPVFEYTYRIDIRVFSWIFIVARFFLWRYYFVPRTMLQGYQGVSTDTRHSTDNQARISMVPRKSFRISVRTKHGPIDPGTQRRMCTKNSVLCLAQVSMRPLRSEGKKRGQTIAACLLTNYRLTLLSLTRLASQ